MEERDCEKKKTGANTCLHISHVKTGMQAAGLGSRTQSHAVPVEEGPDLVPVSGFLDYLTM